MRKHKSVVAILLAVMMIFTFMPTMAFAAVNDVTWAKDYSTVTVETATGPVTFNTARTFVKDSSAVNYGMVHAVADLSDYTGTIDPVPQIDYFDLNNAQFGRESDHGIVTSTYATPDSWSTVRGLVFTVPSYCSNASADANVKAYRSFTHRPGTTPVQPDLNSIGDWQGTVKITKDGEDYTVNTSATYTEDQEFDVSLDVTYNGSATKTQVYGVVNPKHVVVKGAPVGQVSDAEFFMDKVGKTGEGSHTSATAVYDGAEHTVVMAPLKGYDVKWSVYNKKTGEWDAVNEVKVKDVVSGINARANLFLTTNTTTTPDAYLDVAVSVTANANAPYFNYDEDPAPTPSGYGQFEVPAGEEYNPLDYVYVYPYNDSVKTQVKAVAANEAELKAYFTEYAKFTTTTKKSAPNYEYVKFALNEDLTEADLKALDKKYETLISNLGLAANGGSIGTETAAFYRTPATVDTEVEFTNAPSSKTYKGSKTTKAGKLKKTQSFTVTAVANDGAAIAYKLVNANTPKISIDKKSGKITLKKGLAKGTYKIKVKAYVPGKGIFAYETQSITIKIKK